MSALPAGWNRRTGLPQADPVWRIGHRGTDRGTRGRSMLRLEDERPAIPRLWIADTMTTRSAALITIGLLAFLLAFVALAALFAGDISERAGGIVSSVLGTFATVLAGLLLLLRVETLNSKADDAKSEARAAAQVGREIKHDIHNDVLKNKVREAIAEERHMLANRDARDPIRQQLEARGLPPRNRHEDMGT